MDEKVLTILDEAIDLVIHSGEEATLENITKAAFYLKKLYELKVLPNNEN